MIVANTVFDVFLREVLYSMMNKDEIFRYEGNLRRRLKEEVDVIRS